MYLPDSNVLVTRFLSPEGVGEVVDFVLVEDLSRGKRLTASCTPCAGRALPARMPLGHRSEPARGNSVRSAAISLRHDPVCRRGSVTLTLLKSGVASRLS